MRVLAWIIGCVGIAVLWRAVDDWRDRRKAARWIAALHATALEENAAFDALARRCVEEAEKQYAYVPIVPPDAKRAA